MRKSNSKNRRTQTNEQLNGGAGMPGSVSNKKTSKHAFAKTFIVFFLAITVAITGGIFLIKGAGNVAIFGDDNPELSEELETIVDSDSPFFEAFTNSNRVNVLCLGVNQNMADTIMLVSFDMDAKHVDIISVPRDTYYYREGHKDLAAHKINAVMPADGAVGMAKAVSETLLGIPINYYITIEYDGVKKIVDAMGGVPLDVKQDMYYTDPYDKPPLVIDIDKGYQVLDGDHAVQFLRFRHGYADADIGRVRAQQEFVKAAFKQALGLDFIKVVKTGFEVVDSDLKLKTCLSLATKALGMSSEDMTTYTMPHTLYDQSPWYVIADGEGIEQMLTEIYSIQSEKTTEGAVATDSATEGQQ